MKKNQKGSALLWAIIIIGVLVILAAGALTISLSYQTRARQNNYTRQAYLTSKGVLVNIVENIENSNEDYLKLFQDITIKNKFKPIEDEGKQIKLTMTLPTDTIGEITDSYIEIKPKKETKGLITISVTAKYSGQSYDMKADMQYVYKNDSFKWELLKYYRVKGEDLDTSNITVAASLLSEFGEMYKIYVDKGGQPTGYYAVLKIFKNEPGWKNIPNDVKASLENLTYLDDLTIRKFFCYRNESQTFPLFNKSEIKNTKLIVPIASSVTSGTNTVTTIKKEEVDLNKPLSEALFSKEHKDFSTSNYYIQPKYFNDNKERRFVFAGLSSTPSNGGQIVLIYNNNSWYLVGKCSLGSDLAAGFLGPTSFDKATAEQWKYFTDNYLTEGNKIQ